jgi:hypothetical protein
MRTELLKKILEKLPTSDPSGFPIVRTVRIVRMVTRRRHGVTRRLVDVTGLVAGSALVRFDRLFARPAWIVRLDGRVPLVLAAPPGIRSISWK